MTTGEALAAGTAYLDRRGIETPRLETELILAHALGLSRLRALHRPRPAAHRGRASRGAVAARAAGRREPLAYVLGEWGFRTLRLRTDARALVPRPETEFLVERALVALAGERAPRIVDVGTGSGAIALSLAAEYPGALVSATDVSPEALSLAAENAAALGLHVEFVETNLLDGLEGPFDLVVSNPPT